MVGMLARDTSWSLLLGELGLYSLQGLRYPLGLTGLKPYCFLKACVVGQKRLR